MNKELETMSRIETMAQETHAYSLCSNDDYEIIRSALEQNEKLKRFYNIVKTKEVDIGAFKASMKGEPTVIFSYRLYLKYSNYYSKQTLSKEEFKFLKEMLKDGR